MKTGKMKTSKMKTSINLKTSKMKNNYLKLGMMAAVMLSASIGFAQTAPGTAATDEGIKRNNGQGQSIKVIDNKGTIKYLQTNNGITSITSTAPNNTTTTTWQLGGTLTEATNIATGVNEFKITMNDGTNQGSFIIDGVELETGAASTDATTGSIAGTGTGYTFLVRDEVTGKTKKLIASDLITGGQETVTIATDSFTVLGITGPLAFGTAIFKISVYRNGNKLRGSIDYGLTALNQITLIPDVTTSASSWNTLTGDVIEVQWVN